MNQKQMRNQIFSLLVLSIGFIHAGHCQPNEIYDQLTIGLIKGTLRDSPDFESDVITVIDTGDTVTVLKYYKHPFLKIRHNGLIGYISEASIKETEVIGKMKEDLREEGVSHIFTTTINSKKNKKSNIKLRPSPFDTEIIEIVPYNSKLNIIDFESGYWKVKYGNKIGYISDVLVIETKAMQHLKKKKSVNSGNLIKPSTNKNNKSEPTTYYKKHATQCISYTKKGNRCKNKTKNTSRRCHIHD